MNDQCFQLLIKIIGFVLQCHMETKPVSPRLTVCNATHTQNLVSRCLALRTKGSTWVDTARWRCPRCRKQEMGISLPFQNFYCWARWIVNPSQLVSLAICSKMQFSMTLVLANPAHKSYGQLRSEGLGGKSVSAYMQKGLCKLHCCSQIFISVCRCSLSIRQDTVCFCNE